jgi:hypothetical protein
VATAEATEWLVISGPEPLAFPTHETMVTNFFAQG